MVEYTMSPRLLRIAGPAIEVSVNERTGVALLDTGASVSSVDLTFAQALGLPVSGTHRSTGATGEGDYPNFDAPLSIPVLDVTVPSPVGGLPLRAHGHPWDAIVGRDILCQYEFTVNGETGLIRFTKVNPP
jgi:hypothetical protein